MAVLLRHLQLAFDQALGRGLPSPLDALRRARFAPDAPWSWCARCGGPVPAWRCGCAAVPDSPDCVVRLGAHRGALRRWVIDVKHARWEPMAELLGEALAAQLRACGVVEQGDRGASLVPVPMPWLRARARGIDHARVVAASVARVLGVPCRRVLWQGLGATQVGVEARSGRLGERARFGTRCGGRATVAGRHVILVDDVRTTGSTLRACAGLLRGVGASRVTAAVLSVRERSEQLSTGFGAESPASDLRVLGHAV